MNQNLKNVFEFCLGILLAVTLSITGVILTNIFDHEFSALASIILIPVFGLAFYIFKKKYRGIGMFLSTIPIILLAHEFMQISRLH